MGWGVGGGSGGFRTEGRGGGRTGREGVGLVGRGLLLPATAGQDTPPCAHIHGPAYYCLLLQDLLDKTGVHPKKVSVSIHHSSLITHHSSLTTHHHHSSPITHHPSLITHHLSLITSPITNHSSLITHHPPSSGGHPGGQLLPLQPDPIPLGHDHQPLQNEVQHHHLQPGR